MRRREAKKALVNDINGNYIAFVRVYYQRTELIFYKHPRDNNFAITIFKNNMKFLHGVTRELNTV